MSKREVKTIGELHQFLQGKFKEQKKSIMGEVKREVKREVRSSHDSLLKKINKNQEDTEKSFSELYDFMQNSVAMRSELTELKVEIKDQVLTKLDDIKKVVDKIDGENKAGNKGIARISDRLDGHNVRITTNRQDIDQINTHLNIG